MTSQLVVFDSCFGAVNANSSWIDSGLYKNYSWIPNPGPAIVSDPSAWASYDAYLRDVVEVVGGSPAVLIWDMHNEPDFSVPHIVDFIAHTATVLASLDAKGRPRTVGLASSGQQGLVQDIVTMLSFHNYDGSSGGAMLARDIAAQRALAQRLGKPVIITESMSRPNDPLTSVLPAVFGCINATAAAGKGGPPPPYDFAQGFLPSGDDVLVAAPGRFATAADAEAWCDANASCVAFTYAGGRDSIPSAAEVYFKEASGGFTPDAAWSTYLKLAPAAPIGWFVWELMLGVDQFNSDWGSRTYLLSGPFSAPSVAHLTKTPRPATHSLPGHDLSFLGGARQAWRQLPLP